MRFNSDHGHPLSSVWMLLIASVTSVICRPDRPLNDVIYSEPIYGPPTAAVAANLHGRQLYADLDSVPDSSRTSSVLGAVVESLESGLQFMEERVFDLNLDAIIGTRIVEGQLKVLLSRLGTGSPSNEFEVPRDLLVRLEAIRRLARDVSDLATTSVRKHQADYFNKIGPVIGRDFWWLDVESRDLNMSAIVKRAISGEAMFEIDSDGCLAELFGTTGKTDKVCHVTRRCWNLMTSPGYRYYSLTHQTFYLEIGQQFGCFDASMKPMIDRMNAGFCANIYSEAHHIADEGFPENKRDLFMEQAALCGIIGYRQFFCSDWLDSILSWQSSDRGCWGLDHRPFQAIGLGSTSKEADRSVRVKREERLFVDGCECHRTAVAISALVQYVRYVIESPDGQLPSNCPSIDTTWPRSEDTEAE